MSNLVEFTRMEFLMPEGMGPAAQDARGRRFRAEQTASSPPTMLSKSIGRRTGQARRGRHAGNPALGELYNGFGGKAS